MKQIVIVASIVCSSLFGKPPEEVPESLREAYTLGGQIPVLSWYRDDSYPPTKPRHYTTEQLDTNIEAIRRKETAYYGHTDTWLYRALEAFKEEVEGKEVAIIGSVEPWYESVVLAYGGRPTTIEYNEITCSDPRLEIVTVDAFEKNPKQFDVILSISSWEHDGLGRYGDPMNPNGDLESMEKAKSMLRDGGILILAVPVGADALVWNVHRIYGPIRLPMLLDGWDVVATYGFDTEHVTTRLGTNAGQPVFVLQPKQPN